MVHFFAAQGTGIANAGTGIHNAAVDIASLGTSVMELSVLIIGMMIVSSVGGQGIQKPLRQAFLIVFIGAFFLKSYASVASGAMGLF